MNPRSLIGASLFGLLAGIVILLYGVSLNNGSAMNTMIGVGTVIVILGIGGFAAAADILEMPEGEGGGH